jgi:hypothetical protein
MATTGCSEEQARAMLAAYFASKALRIVEYPSPKQRKLRKGLDHAHTPITTRAAP